MLTLNDITKRFRQCTILNEVSLHIKSGTIALVIGPSGAGKSTLLRVVAGLEKPDSGTLFLDGKPLTTREKKVGMLFQHFNLFENMTVGQNIVFPLVKVKKHTQHEAQKIARKLLHMYQLDGMADRYPQNLSGGQKQRLALARTVAMKPKVICLDEPTSALDPLLTSYVANAITELAQQGFIILASSHDTDLIKQLPADLYLMKNGRFIEASSTKLLQNKPSDYPLITQFISGKMSVS